jgi:hypothetical protein
MRARGIGLGFGHHLIARHHICPGLGLGRAVAVPGMGIGRDTSRRPHSKRMPAAAAVPVQVAPVVSCQGGHVEVPYQYCASGARSGREVPLAPVDVSEECVEAALLGHRPDGFISGPATDEDLLANPYKDCS